MELSKCCKAELKPTKLVHHLNEGEKELEYCSKCGLVYKKIKKKLKQDEVIDEWE